MRLFCFTPLVLLTVGLELFNKTIRLSVGTHYDFRRPINVLGGLQSEIFILFFS